MMKAMLKTLREEYLLNPINYPLTMVTENGLNVVYGFSGYNVGLSSLIMKILIDKEVEDVFNWD